MGMGWGRDFGVQTFRKPMHVAAEEDLSVPGALSSFLSPCKHAHRASCFTHVIITKVKYITQDLRVTNPFPLPP